MSRQSPIMPLPVRLRRDFLRRLGYRANVEIVAVLWHQPKECGLIFDGMSFKKADNEQVFVDLCNRIEQWSKEQKVRLKPPRAAPSHWLLIDVPAGDGFVARTRSARQIVLDQKFPEEVRPGEQRRLSF